MKRFLIVLAGCLVLASPAWADDERAWTKEDTLRQLTYTTLHVLDWGTTLDIAEKPDRYHENNPILGKHPSRGDVNAYMATTLILNWAVAYAMPHPYREMWQYAGIAVEAYCVGNNFHIGLRLAF